MSLCSNRPEKTGETYKGHCRTNSISLTDLLSDVQGKPSSRPGRSLVVLDRIEVIKVNGVATIDDEQEQRETEDVW